MNIDTRNASITPSTIALCLGCNYSLHSLPTNRCPECGRPFDLTDAATFNGQRPLSWLDRRLLAPAGPITFIIVALPCAALLWISLDPGIYYMDVYVFLTVFTWAVVAILLGARWFLRATIPPAKIRRPRDHRLRYVYAIVAVTTLLVFFHVPLRIAFLFARDDLDRLVREIHEGKTSVPVPPRRVGPFRVQSSNWYGGNDTLFFTFANDAGSGFAYCPTRGPQGHYNEGNDGHLMGSWHWWTDD